MFIVTGREENSSSARSVMLTFRPFGAWILFKAINYKHCAPTELTSKKRFIAAASATRAVSHALRRFDAEHVERGDQSLAHDGGDGDEQGAAIHIGFRENVVMVIKQVEALRQLKRPLGNDGRLKRA